MDVEVRVKHAEVPSNSTASSHTLHSIRPVNTGSDAISGDQQTRRERLITATVEAVSEVGVDRLCKTLDTPEALYS